MTDVIYFSNEMTTDGETKLVRRDQHLDLDPAPVRVDVVIHDLPVMDVDYTNADPTLARFHEPKEERR